MMRLSVLALAAAAAAAATPDVNHAMKRRLQPAPYHWTTEHHDTRNSGNSGEAGPAEATGVCKTTVSASRDGGQGVSGAAKRDAVEGARPLPRGE